MTQVEEKRVSITELGATREEVQALRDAVKAVDERWPGMKRARAVEKARSLTGVTYEVLAELTGSSKNNLCRYVGLVQRLAPELQDAVDKGHLRLRTATLLATVRGHSLQRELAARIISDKLRTAEVELIVVEFRQATKIRVETLIAALRDKPVPLPALPAMVRKAFPILHCQRCGGSGTWDPEERQFKCRMCNRGIARVRATI